MRFHADEDYAERQAERRARRWADARRRKAERVRAGLIAMGLAGCAAPHCLAVVDPDEATRCQLHRCALCGEPAEPTVQRGRRRAACCSMTCARRKWDEERGPCLSCGRGYSAHGGGGWGVPRECAGFLSRARLRRSPLVTHGYTDTDLSNMDPFGSRAVWRAAYGE